ncbi:hypothetical protein [Anatilimnocola floriformis]|uniref:hypothetical protein n=1 Tax=Anatilimnocola floriformis TaxID=2948575 RepID=UPI0020C4A97D|nr:hypothetical protein [Anatilimnocola floriformis]
MSKLKSKGKIKAESVASDVAGSAPSHPDSANVTPVEQQAIDGFLDLLARLIAKAHFTRELNLANSPEVGTTGKEIKEIKGNEGIAQ